ncbi:hypothetical protein [Labilibaculum sp.]|uniref:hypothetical protein n=1 Tax=Labilibaculum sp. TaxID=2060723 RepID=UPI002AA87122|nr:hypothetical protein [Labilibaculum sp.]
MAIRFRSVIVLPMSGKSYFLSGKHSFFVRESLVCVREALILVRETLTPVQEALANCPGRFPSGSYVSSPEIKIPQPCPTST